MNMKNNWQAKSTTIWNKTFISLFFATMVMSLGQQLTSSLVSKYADHLGATAPLVGMITSMFAVTALVFKIVSGPMIDTYNRKLILMGAMSIMLVAYVGYSFSTSVWSLMAFRLVQGTGQAFSATCCLVLAADTLPADKYGVGIGYFSLAQVACQAVGPALALLLVDIVGYQTTFAVGATVMALAILVTTQVKTEGRKAGKLKISLNNIIAKEALIPTTIMFFLNMAFTVISSFLIIYAGRQGMDSGIGLFFTVYAVTLLFTRPVIGRLTDRYGLVRIAIPAILCTAASFIMISFSSSLISFLAAAVVSAFGFGACQPAIQSLSMKSVPKERRGAASSTNYIGNDMGNLTGPVIAGFIIERCGYVFMWRIMTLPLIVAIVVVILCRRRIASIESRFTEGNAKGIEKLLGREAEILEQ